MQVKVIDFYPDARNFRVGFADIEIIYSGEKSETFRNLTFFEKEGKKWLSFPNFKRGEKWIPYYDRKPFLQKEILILALKSLDQFLVNLAPTALVDENASEPEKDTDMF